MPGRSFCSRRRRILQSQITTWPGHIWKLYGTISDPQMLEFLKANWSDILAHIAQHVWLVFISIAIAVAIALPLGILITRRQKLRGPVLGIANVMQTIPSLALFG